MSPLLCGRGKTLALPDTLGYAIIIQPGQAGKLPRRLKGTKKDFDLNTSLCLGDLVAKLLPRNMHENSN
jgi:hypothetical protein